MGSGFEIAKTVCKFATSVGIGAVVTNAVKYTTPEDLNAVKRYLWSSEVLYSAVWLRSKVPTMLGTHWIASSKKMKSNQPRNRSQRR